jgi:hypothetical protein
MSRDLRYGPIAAPMTASMEPPVLVGQLVNTSQYVKGSHLGNR